MKTYSELELKEIIRNHGMWLRGEDGGERANLSGANLSGANLREADLIGANLHGADLSRANLSGANLRRADLSGANLRGANLSGADLSWADLSGADLSGANLSGANLCEANLCDADLRRANLSGANLRGANLREANLREANLSGAINGHVCRMDFGGWSICVREDVTSIGCKTHDNSDWLRWTHESSEIMAMELRASEWWRVHGDAIKAAIRCVMAKAGSERKSKEGKDGDESDEPVTDPSVSKGE